MSTDQWAALAAVILVTALVFTFGWQSCAWHLDRSAARRQLETDMRAAAARGYRPGRSREARYWPTPQGWAASAPDSSPATFADKPGEARYWPTPRGWAASMTWQDWSGAQDRQYEVPAQPDPMAMAATGYALGVQRATADEVTREAAAIWAEVEANPDLWRHR